MIHSYIKLALKDLLLREEIKVLLDFGAINFIYSRFVCQFILCM